MHDKSVSVCINLLLLPPSFGGIGNVAYHHLARLVELRPDWTFFLLVSSDTASHFRDIPGLRILEVRIRSRWGRLAYLHLLFPFKTGRFSIVHSAGNMGLVLGCAPQVITIHDTYEHVSPERFSWAKRAMMKFLIAASGSRARRIITVSESTRRDIGKYYPGLARKTTVIYSGNKFPIRPGADAGIRDGFLFVGTLEPGKNLALVLEAFAVFRRKHPGKLRVIGAKGWKQSSIPGLITGLGIAEDVEMLGFVDDARLQEEYGRALALIQASSYEGFGLPVIEAMANGCPVIAARNSGLIESGGPAALFFETGDALELSRRMEAVHTRTEIREKCIREGLLHAGRFTWEKSARELLRVYTEVIGAASAPGRSGADDDAT